MARYVVSLGGNALGNNSEEQKKALIETITSKLENELGIQPTDIFIVIYDPPNENWGFGGKQRS